MANQSSPYAEIHNVGKTGDPKPERKLRYVVRQEGSRFAVYFGTKSYRSFVSRFSAQYFADACNKQLNDPTSMSED